MKKTIKYLILSLSLIPLLVDNSVFQRLTISKSLLAMVIIFIVSVLFLSNLFIDKKFKSDILNKIKTYLRNPIFISLSAFLFFILLSVPFALDKYHAFWGDVDRAEGFVGIFALALIFFYSLLIFEKKDWLWFFRLSIITSIVLFGKALVEFHSGISRPESFIGNPALLAGYFIFPIFCSIYVWFADEHKFFKYLSMLGFISAILGIFITQTRGTILGVVVGFICVLIYGVWKGKNSKVFKFNLRKLSLILLAVIFAFSLLFIFTRHNTFWQKVPGLSRVAQISDVDATTQTRLLLYKNSLKSVNPATNPRELIFGWGQDNFIIAYLKNFDPKQFNYEDVNFDRAHNRFFDVLVMNGIFGLISYLAIFLFVVISLLRQKDFSPITAGIIFWLFAYLMHLLVLFDNVDSYIPFFIMLSFILFTYSKGINVENKCGKISGIMIISSSAILSIFLGYVLFANYIPGYIQLREFKSLVDKKDIRNMVNNSDRFFYPFTFAQTSIRRDILKALDNGYKKDDKNKSDLADISFERAEEYLNKIPWDLRMRGYISTAYTNIGNVSGNKYFIEKGVYHFDKLLEYSPLRANYALGLGLNLYIKKDYINSLKYFELAFNNNPNLYAKDKSKIEKIYIQFYKYFYKERDLNNFKIVTARLKNGGSKDSAMLDKVSEFMEQYGRWPNIIFE